MLLPRERKSRSTFLVARGVSPFWEGDEFFAALLHDINSAGISICLESYIFHADQAGDRIVQALLDAARRGVRVRVLVDGVGSFPAWNLARGFRGSTAAFRIFKPVGFFTVFKSGFHRRNHRKLILIDDRIAYAGGMNIGDELSLEYRGSRRWRDNMVRVEQGDFSMLRQSFEEIWTFSGKKSFGLLPRSRMNAKRLKRLNLLDPDCPDVLFMSNHGRALRRTQRRLLVQQIKNARHRIYIGSAYFVPGRRILWLLRRKAASGVDVRILTAGRSDVWLARQAGRSTYRGLLKHGIRIFEYQDRMYHAKINIIDERVMIGSTNMDYRSFLHNLEVDAWINREEIAEAALNQWHLDEIQSQRILLERWKRRSLLERLMEKVAFLLRFYL
ncbi:MAG: cardiolipin synthase B [Leptospiraceae bacterium]|nr:cardiolipin synthase B [Leptospiraceae bacterium]